MSTVSTDIPVKGDCPKNVRFNVAILSQPLEPIVSKVYTPPEVYVSPFQSKLSETVTSEDDEVGYRQD